MLRTRPLTDDDTLFQVGYDLAEPVGDKPAGEHRAATFGKTFMEAIHVVRNQFGPAHANQIAVREVFAREREKNGTIHDTYFYPPPRRRVTTPAVELEPEDA